MIVSPPAIPEGLDDLLGAFVAEMEKDTARLRDLAGDRAELAVHAHAMRGKCAMFGEEILYGLLARIETEAAGLGGNELAVLIAAVVERAVQLREYAGITSKAAP